MLCLATGQRLLAKLKKNWAVIGSLGSMEDEFWSFKISISNILRKNPKKGTRTETMLYSISVYFFFIFSVEE
jgi:hypothetical protein